MTNSIQSMILIAAGLLLSACSGMQPIHRAALNGNLAQVRDLVGQGQNVNARSNVKGDYNQYTPLSLALEHGHTDIIKYLIEKGADINAATAEGITPLHIAAHGGLTDAVKLLLEKGADTGATTNTGQTPLHMAAIALHNNIATMRLLLDHGADVNAGRGSEFGTPLERAAYYGSAPVAEFLIDHGADINARDSYGGTALHMAAKNGRVRYAQTLLSHHGDVNAKRKDGATPLHWAAVNGRTTIVQMLIDKGASVLVTDAKGKTPLELAVTAKYTATADLLRKNDTSRVAGKADPVSVTSGEAN